MEKKPFDGARSPEDATRDHLIAVAKHGANYFGDQDFFDVVDLLDTTEPQEPPEPSYPVYELRLPSGFDYRNVRESTNGEVVGKLHDGDRVEITKMSGNWGKIRLMWDISEGVGESNKFDGMWVYMGSMVPYEESHEILGVDLSKWNIVHSFPKLYNAGYRFVISRTTRGLDYADHKHSDFMHRAKDAGFLLGSYHLFAEGSGVAQADYYWENSVMYDARPVMDLEITGLDQRQIQEFLVRVESKFGMRPLIYTNWNTMMAYGFPSWMAGYDLWIASYTAASKPTMPDNWTEWVLWQFSSKGRPPGTEGNIDLNRFYGSYSELKELL